jgi:hypothetical protein
MAATSNGTGLYRSVGMTLEAIDPNRREGMAAAAEMLFAAVARCIGRIADMAVDAFHEAVLLRAYTLVHGPVPLVQDVLHVVPAHVVDRLDTFLCLAEAGLGFGYFRKQAIPGKHGTLWRECQQADGEDRQEKFSHRFVSGSS